MSEPITVPITAEDLNAIRTGASVSLARQVLQLPIDGMLEALREIAAIDAPPGYSPAPATQAAGDIEAVISALTDSKSKLWPLTPESRAELTDQLIATLRAQQQTIDAMRKALALAGDYASLKWRDFHAKYPDIKGIDAEATVARAIAAAIAATPESK